MGQDCPSILSSRTDAWFSWGRLTPSKGLFQCLGWEPPCSADELGVSWLNGAMKSDGCWLCQKQMEKQQWTFSCKPEACRARGGNPATHGCAVPHNLRAGCKARRQDMPAVQCLAPFMVCMGPHSCSLGSAMEGISRGKSLSSISSKLPLQ